MRRGSSQKASSPSKNVSHLMSTMSSATENNARVRSNTLSIRDKVESARRHLKSHQQQFHTGEDSSSGESVENRSPHHAHRSRSSPRDVTHNTANSRGREKQTSSVLYSAELQHVRRVSGDARRRSNPVKKDSTSRVSPAKSVSPVRNNTSFYNQSMHDFTLTTSPRRRSTYVVAGKRDFSNSFRGDTTFTKNRRETFTIDRRDDTTVSHDETVIAPGLLEEEFRPRKQRTHSHGSSSQFHARCVPKDAHSHEVSNIGKWDIDFLPGSLINAKKVEKDRRSAAFDLLAPNAEAIRYQEERTRREEEELMRVVREQSNGRSTKEIFDSWVPLDEERRKRKGEETEEGETGTAKVRRKSTRRLWEEETEEDGEMLRVLGRRGKEEERRVVMEDEAGYAMPLPREVVDRSLRTPSPLPLRQPSPDEQFFTPATSAPRLSRVSGLTENKADGETPIMGRNSARLSSTFVMDRTGLLDRSVRRLRGGADEADRSVGSSFQVTPDRRDESIEGGERSLGEYATPVGRRGGEGGRREEEERSFLNTSSHDRSRGALNESMRVFETSINRSLDHLSSLATRLSSSLEASKANLSAIGAPTGAAATPPRDRERGGGLEGVAGDRRLGVDASILDSLSPLREERHSVGGDELRRIMTHSVDRDHRSSLPDERRIGEGANEEETRMIVTSPIPRPRSTVPSPRVPPTSSVHGLTSLLEANIGRFERTEVYEREADRLEGVVREMNETASKVENTVKEKEKSLPSLPSSSAPPIPPPRPSRSSAPTPSVPRTHSPLASAANPRTQLAIETAGGRDELMEMYEARHRNWHRRGDDTPVPSPRSPMSRSPSPLPPALSNPAELRERQSVQGMLDQRGRAVRGAFLHLLQRLYRARFETRYDEKKQSRGDAVSERQFAEVQKREEEAFRREANEAKKRAIDPTIRYRDFMQWLKEESERMEDEIQCEVERRERRRWERKMRSEGVDQSLLDSSRLSEADKQLDERAKKALKARQNALNHVEKREQVRRMEKEARRAVVLAEIPSSARSSLDDGSFLQSLRRYSTGNEPLRVSSARGGTAAEMSMNASREGRAQDDNRSVSADRSGGEKRKEVMSEMKERLEEKRRQAEEVRRAMEESERRMTETELVSVAAQLAAHEEYIRGVEGVGRVIAQNVQPRSPTGLPPGVEPLDLSSLDEEGEGERKRENSLDKSIRVSGKDTQPRSVVSRDSLDGIPPSVPSSHPSTSSSSSSVSKSSSSTSTSSSNKTLRATEELSQLLEEITVHEETKESTVPGEQREDTVDPPQFSPLSEGRNDELDRSLPSTAASTGRQELTLDTVPTVDTVTIPETTVPVESVEVPSTIDTPQVPTQPVHTVEKEEEEESIPEEIEEMEGDTVERSTVPSRALFSPIESSTSHSEETESSSDRGGITVGGGGRSTVVKSEESTTEESEESVEREGENLDVSNASLKKAISVASEMANPFDGFESSSDGSRKSEEKEREKEKEKKEEEIVQSAFSATTTSSLDQSTVLEKSPIVQREKEDEDEISWGDGGGLEVGGGSARSADFDWGLSTIRSEEKKEEEEKVSENPHTLEIEKEEKEEETKPISTFASLRDRLAKISVEDEDEKRETKPSSSSSSTATSSSRSGSSSTTTSTEKSTSEETGGSSGTSTERKEEKEEEDEDKTPRVPSAASGGLSSASGSIDFDADVALPVVETTSSRTPRAPSRSRFRLSLDDSFPESPRDTTTTHKLSSSLLNGRVIGAGSPRVTTPTSPHTPRAMVHPHISPSGSASPEGRRSRFTAVMPVSPRSGRRSTSPKTGLLSREVSFAQDDSSFGDISRLSAVELPTSGGVSGSPPILSSLPPLSSPSLSLPLPSSRPSIGQSLNGSSIDEEDEMDESVYDLMDIKTPVGSVLSSLPIAELIGEKSDEREEERWMVSPPVTLTARSNGSLHEQSQVMNKREFIQPRIDVELDQIWKTIEKKGFFAKEDVGAFADLDLEDGNDDITVFRNERISLIRAVSAEVAANLYTRDLRETTDGRSIPSEIIPLRKIRPPFSKDRLRAAIEKELQPMQSRESALVTSTRMRNLGVDMATLPVEDRLLYTELYSNEDILFQSDIERWEIVEELMKL